MIYAFNFTCDRDWDLRTLMLETYTKYSGFSSWSSVNTDVELKDYGNGAGWQASMLKLQYLKKMLSLFPVKDDDFILSVDSDVVFTSPEVFKYIRPEYGIIGIKHRPNYNSHFGDWSHMSGALIFIRGDIAKRMSALDESTLANIRFRHFKPYRITENEDVVLSYLARFCEANYFDLGTVDGLTSGDFENEIIDNRLKSFYHLNYCPIMFLGEEVTGKWDIPNVLKQKGIEL